MRYEYESIIKELNKELRYIKGEIGVGMDRDEKGQAYDTYYLYINSELIFVDTNIWNIVKKAIIYIAD